MKYIIYCLVLAAASLPVVTFASELNTKSFSVNPVLISKIKNSDITRFNFKTEIYNDDVVSWKIRFTCTKNVRLSLTNSGDDVCHTAQKLTNKDFDVYFKNTSNYTAPFSFKLKGYDVNGKWVYSDKKTFQWR